MKDFGKVLNMQKHGEASMCPKLTEKHLDCEGHTRQNVLLAFQLLSRSVANCLIRRSTLDYDLVSHRIFSRNRGLFSGEDVMILYIHILIHLIA